MKVVKKSPYFLYVNKRFEIYRSNVFLCPFAISHVNKKNLLVFVNNLTLIRGFGVYASPLTK